MALEDTRMVLASEDFPILLQLLRIPGPKGLNDLPMYWAQHCGSHKQPIDGLIV